MGLEISLSELPNSQFNNIFFKNELALFSNRNVYLEYTNM